MSIVQDRENKLRDQVAALEARVSQQLQLNNGSAAHWAAKTAASIPTTYTSTSTTAASSPPPRPDSRASTIYPSRTATPTASLLDSHYRASTPPTSVYDSMHAPRASTVGSSGWEQLKQQGSVSVPRSRFAAQQDWRMHSRVASPTPSVVSAVPTLSHDGWFE